jgi:hypothetical protein
VSFQPKDAVKSKYLDLNMVDWLQFTVFCFWLWLGYESNSFSTSISLNGIVSGILAHIQTVLEIGQ